MNKEKKSLDDLKLKADDIFGILNCIEIISNIDNFKKWLKKKHKIDNFDNIFEGYKFFLESAIRTFLHTIIYDSSLDIKEDFVFYRARFVGVELSKIPNTCEKTIFIKNINDKLKLIKKAKSYDELKLAINDFKNNVSRIFTRIYDENVTFNSALKCGKEDALRYITMFYTYIFLNDTSRFIPHGYWVCVLDNRIRPEQHKKSFEGYKYSLQYVWSSLIGKKYHSTSIKNLHKAKDWSIKDDLFSDLKQKPKAIIKRNDLDSYFEKVQREIIEPIEKKLKVSFGFSKILYLKRKISKNKFGNLLNKPKEPQLNEKEKLDYNLLWYQIEFLDSSKSHIFNGVPAFISLLLGTAELKSRFAENEKVYICKFIHPDKSVNGNDFSYGVLIEAFGSIGISDYSGWILFFDCCGDYSGFAGSEHAMAEMFIEEYRKRGMIEIRETTIDKNKLKEYIADKITSDKREEILQILEEETTRRRERNIVSEARGLVLELITYYTLSKKLYDLVEWNIEINRNQLDVILETKNDFILIECKYDANNTFFNINKEIKKLKTKLNNHQTKKNKKCAFWFWFRPHSQIIDKLRKKEIDFEVVSELIENDSIWKNKKKDKLKLILNHK
jgi:hypothetical protein